MKRSQIKARPGMVDEPDPSNAHVISITTGVKGIGEGEEEGIMSREMFCKEFLEAPCFGCRAETHGLLEALPKPSTRSGKRRYKYSCQVVKCNPLYTGRAGEEMDMSFQLSARDFARDCGYDLSTAVMRIPSYLLKKGEGITQYACLFYSEVRKLCTSHGRVINAIEA